MASMSFSCETVCSRASSDGYKSFGCWSPRRLFEPQLIEQSPKYRVLLKSRDSYWGHACASGSLILISPIMKKYSSSGFPIMRQRVSLDLLLTSKVQGAIWNFLVERPPDCSTISNFMTYIPMIPTIKGFSHIFRSRLTDRLEEPK